MVTGFEIEWIVNFNFRGYPQAGGALKEDVEFLWETLTMLYFVTKYELAN